MSDLIEYKIGEHTATFLVNDVDRTNLAAASSGSIVMKASQNFTDAISIVGGLADEFSSVLKDRNVESAEISVSLKASIKGDFILVGSSGEASIEVKLTVKP